MSTNDHRVSQEWMSRPDDQRFLTVDALYESVLGRRKECRQQDVALDAMQIQATEGNELMLTDKAGLTAQLNNWSFGQLCARTGTPAGYLRKMPAEIAAINLQWSMEMNETAREEGNDAKLLIRKNGHTSITAINGPGYGRIWDSEVVQTIRKNVDLDVWKVPGATYASKDPLRATTLYASDRDIFIFLVSEKTIDTGGESLNRGFYVWNSEVGSATFGFAAFTFDKVCDNRIIWGQDNFRQITIRHTSGGPHRFAAQAAPQLVAYANAGTGKMVEAIKAAKAKVVGKDKDSVIAWMRARGFTTPMAKRAYEKAERDPRGYNPRTVWGLVQGVTDAAHDITHTDDRVAIEEKAGTLLEMAAA